MTLLQQFLTITLASCGLLLMLTGSIGLLRLPDFYARSHATSKADTLGVMIVLLAFAIHEGFTLGGAKLLLAMTFTALANPVAAHALARAALHLGLRPWTQTHRPTANPEI